MKTTSREIMRPTTFKFIDFGPEEGEMASPKIKNLTMYTLSYSKIKLTIFALSYSKIKLTMSMSSYSAHINIGIKNGQNNKMIFQYLLWLICKHHLNVLILITFTRSMD